MAKLIVGAAAAAIAQKTGTSPQILLQILYTLGLQNFATKDLTISGGGTWDGAITEIGDVISQVKKDSSATVSTCSITLSDVNGLIKNGLDTTIFEKAKANLYLYYEGTGAGDIIPLIIGNVNGPVTWDETNRTTTFGIESVIENQDVGFAPTQDDFADLDPAANGVPWPMIFGKAVHVPALKIHKKATGSLLAPIRFYTDPAYTNLTNDVVLPGDPTVWNHLVDTAESQVIYINGLDTFPSGTTKITIDGVIFQGTIDATVKTKFNVTHCNLPKYTNKQFAARVSGDQDINSPHVAWLADDSVKIINCAVYYQWTTGPIYYNYCVRQIGKKCWFRYPFIKYTTNSSLAAGSVSIFKPDANFKITEAYPIQKNGMIYDIQEEIQDAKAALIARQGGSVGLNPFGSLLSKLDKMRDEANSWWHSSSDSLVRPFDDSDADLYIASLVQLSEVKAIYGKKKLKGPNNKTYEAFQPIPESYYTTESSTYTVGTTGQFATAIIFETPLSDYKDQDWEDGIWVTATSTIGPNPIDIITWIIENFTDFTMDTTGLSTFRTDLRPANFALFDKRDAFQVCEEIAWQSRMGMIVDLGQVSLRFLPRKPLLPTVTFTDNNVDKEDGISLTYTPINSIVTKVITTWTDTYKEKIEGTRLKQSAIDQVEAIIRSVVPQARRSFSETKYYIYQNNIDIFGNRPVQRSMYIFNQPSPVKEAIDFHGFRESNCWRKVQVKGFPDALTLQCFDTAQLALTDTSILSSGPWTALVVGTRFKFSEMSVTVDVEIPCKAGSGADLSTDYWPGNTF